MSSSTSPRASAPRQFVLKVPCPGTRGIVAAIGNFLADRGCNITEMSQYDDENQGRYFSRVVFRTDTTPAPNLDELKDAFRATASRFDMEWEMRAQDDKARV